MDDVPWKHEIAAFETRVSNSVDTIGGGPDGLSEKRIGDIVEAFYAKVRRDPLLGPVFAGAIAEDAWPEHLAVIRDFWSSVMLKTGRYSRNPFSAHLRVRGITPELFERWLALWRETCLEVVGAEAAEALYAKAVTIAASLKAGLFFRPAADAPT